MNLFYKESRPKKKKGKKKFFFLLFFSFFYGGGGGLRSGWDLVSDFLKGSKSKIIKKKRGGGEGGLELMIFLQRI